MGVEGGMKCIKYLVFFFNFIFWLCGIALIALGIFVQIELKDTLVMTGPASASAAPIVILSVGVIVFFISFFGCCGAAKENYCMITTFAILLTLIFLVEIAAAIAGYIFKDKVRTVIENEIQEEMNNYNRSLDVKKTLDNLQKKYSCCGVASYTDWFNVTKPEPGKVPASCCKNSTDCTKNPTRDNTYEEGCVKKIELWLRNHIVIVAAVALGIAFFEILGIIFACCLMKGIRSGYEVM
ncbi:CD63 antigen [Pseudonaja textilis]|uniref:Tetraspanin n=1 Tax=Pseudonaja textilis TaxID=8673 RepID=A0A670YE80_PSETE|nr:CD63 antigen [Pseudonaja textilis]XP_026566940.1 CD63 antigen [Pseudonaja textilis]XP_026566941.1 CD63 antigen [Pseudonaja textilis]XP_026566942.1 CD63 antigen [Pseudonaja textilis]